MGESSKLLPNRAIGENHAAAKSGGETRKPDQTRLCGDQKAMDSRAHQCVDQSVPGVVEQLRGAVANKRGEDTDLRDTTNLAAAGVK